jgi:hypothetical protein
MSRPFGSTQPLTCQNLFRTRDLHLASAICHRGILLLDGVEPEENHFVFVFRDPNNTGPDLIKNFPESDDSRLLETRAYLVSRMKKVSRG